MKISYNISVKEYIMTAKHGIRSFLYTKERKRRAELKFWKKRFSSEGSVDKLRSQYFEAYCHYLCVERKTFRNKIMLDIGCGPHGAISMFDAKIKIGVDPLLKKYQELVDLPNLDVIYLDGGAENLPLIDNSVDVIVSRNAIDHVDNVAAVMNEIYRVLRFGGELFASVNYQEKPTKNEPHVLNDEKLKVLFNNRIDYKIVKRFPKNYDSAIGEKGVFKYPHEIVTVRGIKI